MNKVENFSEIVIFVQVRNNSLRKLRKKWIIEFDVEVLMSIALIVKMN